MNPIRSLAPDMIRGNFQTSWIYVIGPLLGAIVGVLFEWILKGKPTAAGAIAAQGSSSDGPGSLIAGSDDSPG
jgi:aquaporin Z